MQYRILDSVSVHSKFLGLSRFTETEQQPHQVHLNVGSSLPLVSSQSESHLPGMVYEGNNRANYLHEQGAPVVVRALRVAILVGGCLLVVGER